MKNKEETKADKETNTNEDLVFDMETCKTITREGYAKIK